MLDHRCVARAVIKRCTNFGGAVVIVVRADTDLLERFWALKQRSIVVINFGLALVWRCLCRTNALFRSLPLRQRYNNAGLSGAPCFPHTVRVDERCRNFDPSPCRSRNATTTFVWWHQGLKACTQRPHSVPIASTRRSQSVLTAFMTLLWCARTCCSVLTARAHGAHTSCKVFFHLFFIFWATHFCEKSDLIGLFEAICHSIQQ